MNKKLKQLLSVILSVLMLLPLFSATNVYAATHETEPNDYKAAATKLVVGTKCKGEIGSYAYYEEIGDEDVDWYAVKLKKNRRYRFNFPNYNKNFGKTSLMVYIFTPSGSELEYMSYVMEDRGEDYCNFKSKKAGTYYIRLDNYFDIDTDKEHPYTIWITDRDKKKEKGVTLNKTSATVIKGKTVQLKATTNPKGKKVTWSSSNKKIAKVTKKGKVTAKKVGTAKITAKFKYKGKTYKKTCKIKVVSAPKINKTKLSMYNSDTYKLKVTGGSGSTTWSSSNKAVAKVSKSGTVTALKHGTCTISAKKNGKTMKCTVTVSKTSKKIPIPDFGACFGIQLGEYSYDEGTYLYTYAADDLPYNWESTYKAALRDDGFTKYSDDYTESFIYVRGTPATYGCETVVVRYNGYAVAVGYFVFYG